MALKAGIVGLPNVGKSTLFNCLSSAKAQAANFPFCTIDAQMGQVSVPDERLTKLAELVHPGRIVPAVCDIVDIAGLVKGASKGEGLGNQFLGNIRECDAIIHVLRCFDNGNIVHVDGSVNPVRDKEIIDTELQLKDLDTVENRIKRVEKIAKVGGDKAAKIEYELLLRYKDALEQGQSARTVIPQNDDEEQCAKQMFLLTTKPVLYVCNVDDVSAASGNQYVEQVREAIKGEDAELIIISAQTEADIAELETYEEKQMFLEDLGLKESGCNRLIKAIYSLLNLETVENRIKRVEKIAKVGGDKAAKIEYELLLRYKDALEQGQSARTVIPQNDDEEQCAKQMFLLTTKPVLYVCNVDDVSAAGGNQYVEQVREAIKGEDAELIIISAQTEADIAELETYEEKQMFLEDLGLKESGCNRLIKAIYSLLNLETFITAGEMEVKAWTYRKGWKAPQCAGVIHTDFEKGFIRAEVIKYEDYIKYGSETAVREAGKLGVEGKEYVVQDGDIMHFRFNV